jgi:hypothetical protein
MPCSAKQNRRSRNPLGDRILKRLLRGGRVHLNGSEITANAKEQLLTDLLVSLIRQADVDRQFTSRRNDSITAILTVVEHATHAAATLLYITALWSGAKA